jgi:hypothetical protein
VAGKALAVLAAGQSVRQPRAAALAPGRVTGLVDVRQVPALKPHVEAGIGFFYASLEDGRDEDDVSFLIPLGFGLEYRLSRQLSLDTTFLLNVTDVDPGKNDSVFRTWLVGVKMPF